MRVAHHVDSIAAGYCSPRGPVTVQHSVLSKTDYIQSESDTLALPVEPDTLLRLRSYLARRSRHGRARLRAVTAPPRCFYNFTFRNDASETAWGFPGRWMPFKP